MTPEDYLLMCDAAKAAGYDIWWKNGTCKGGPYLSAFIGDKPWRPLEDDGDAFRLAVAHGMVVTLWGVTVMASRGSTGFSEQVAGQDRAGAARRAIVKCAAGEPRHA